LKRDVAALCLYLQPSTHPLPPMYTQFHPRSPNPGAPDTRGFAWWGWKAPKNRQRVATPKRQNATESPLRILLFPTPSTNNQVPADRYPTASFLLSHARTSSHAQDMSFATLCLTWVHVFGTGVGQLVRTMKQKAPNVHRGLSLRNN
jgi:hypothetical protein